LAELEVIGFFDANGGPFAEVTGFFDFGREGFWFFHASFAAASFDLQFQKFALLARRFPLDIKAQATDGVRIFFEINLVGVSFVKAGSNHVAAFPIDEMRQDFNNARLAGKRAARGKQKQQSSSEQSAQGHKLFAEHGFPERLFHIALLDFELAKEGLPADVNLVPLAFHGAESAFVHLAQ
jgi:hypothetical protein